MTPVLDAAEARVLGCLVEKEATTPEYYPLTLNAIVNACNQKSNRDPVVSFTEDEVADALDRLRDKHLAFQLTGGGSRVPKFGHRLVESLSLGRRESALLCELLLRGPQTVGELRNRADRMHSFSDLDEVEGCLRTLAERTQDPLVTSIGKSPGMKEPRFAHLLGGPPAIPTRLGEITAAPPQTDRVTRLEAELEFIKTRMENLESRLAQFERQFQ